MFVSTLMTWSQIWEQVWEEWRPSRWGRGCWWRGWRELSPGSGFSYRGGEPPPPPDLNLISDILTVLTNKYSNISSYPTPSTENIAAITEASAKKNFIWNCFHKTYIWVKSPDDPSQKTNGSFSLFVHFSMHDSLPGIIALSFSPRYWMLIKVFLSFYIGLYKPYYQLLDIDTFFFYVEFCALDRLSW